MSRRRKSGVSETSPKDQKANNDDDDDLTMNDSKTEWSEQEKNRLLDALKKDEGKNSWRWIARQVKTRTTAQVKEFAAKLRTEKQASNKRPIAPKDDSPLEGWINVTKRLRGDDDVDGACIPQNQSASAAQSKESPGKKDNRCNNHMDHSLDKDEDGREDHQDPAGESTDENQTTPTSKSNRDNRDQTMDNLMEDLLTNQREMMEKISALDLKLEKLQSDDQSSQSTLMELLIKVNERLDQLDKNSSHTCCGGPVILQTTRHANVVHQPILDPCFSCRDAKRIHRIESSSTAPSKDHTLTKERDDQIFSPPLNAASIRTSHVCSMESDTSKSISGKQPRVDLVSVMQNEPSPEPQILHVATCNRTSSPRVTSSFHSMPPIDASPLLKNKQDNSMRKLPWVPENGVNTSVLSSKKTLPVTGEHFPKDDACIFVFKESGPSPNRSRSESQSSVATTASTTSLLTDVSTVPRQQRVSSPQTEHSKLSSPSLAKHLTMPSTQGVSPVQVMLAPSSQPSHTDRHMGLIDGHAGGKEPSLHVTEIQPDHQSTATVSPVTLSTITKNTATCYYPVAGASSQPSHSIPQQAVVVVNSSTCSTPSPNSSDQHSSRVQVPSLSPSSAQKNIPPGYISLSHTLDVQPSPCTVKNTKAWQPQTVLTTSASHSMQQGTEFHGSSATRAILQRSDEVSSRPDKVLGKEVLSAAMLLSSYVSEHPNQQDQTQWQTCLNAIISDYQRKKQDLTRTDHSQLASVGYNPHMLLTQHEVEDLYRKCRTRPQFFALRLAEKLFGLDVLMRSTPNGIGGKAALDPTILDAIKFEVLQRFSSGLSYEQQAEVWKGCLTSIAQRCKRLRNPHRKRSSAAMTASNDGEGPPSMAIGKDLQYDKCENPQAESDDEDEEYDMDNLDRPSSCHTPPVVRVSSDSEQEDSHISPRDVLPGNDNSDIRNLKQSEDSSARPESTFDSRKEADDKEQDVHVPPGIDPNITVVYLPSTLQTALQPREADKRPSSALLQANGADNNVRLKESENVSAQIVHIQEPYEHKRDSVSPVHNLPVACKYYGDHPPVEGNIYKPGPLTAENVIVSGIKMSPDYSYVLVGGNPNVALPRQKYLDSLTRSGQPTHFAVRLAELTFGDEVLRASTVTGAKPGTLQLDPAVIDAIQTEVTDRFLKDLSKEQQTVIWRKCVTSIATRCKTLRYNRSKAQMQAENQWTIHPDQDNTDNIMTIAAMEPVQPGDAASASPDCSQIYTLLSRVMRGQPPPDLSPLDARVILDLMADLEHRLAGHDISSQVNFITNKYKEVMQSQDTASSSTQRQLASRQAKATSSTSDPGASSSSKPKTPLFSLNPLNVPVQLLNLKKSTPASCSKS